MAVFALVPYLESVKEPIPNFIGVVRLNGQEVLRRNYTADPTTWQEKTVTLPASTLHAGVNQLTFSRGRGYRAVLLHHHLASGSTASRGREVGRGRYAADQTRVLQARRAAPPRDRFSTALASSPDDRFDTNDRVVVRLTLTSKQRLRYVLITDPFPAGLEPSARGDVGFMDWRCVVGGQRRARRSGQLLLGLAPGRHSHHRVHCHRPHPRATSTRPRPTASICISPK